MAKNDIKQIITQTFGIGYFYNECKFDDENQWGQAIPQLNIIYVDADLTGIDYAVTLAHELAHCKFQCSNECYTEYKAIITLCESGNEWCEDVGYTWVNAVLSGARSGTKYDCGYYLIKYFNEI